MKKYDYLISLSWRHLNRPELARTDVGMDEDTVARQMHFHAKLTHIYTAFNEHLR